MSASSVASYIAGQCTAFVAETLDWVPAGWGNASEWIGNAKAQGYQVSQIPVPGSVAVYGPGAGFSEFGHVAVVNHLNGDGTFNVSEENFSKGPFGIDSRDSGLEHVMGFILPPGSKAPAEPPVTGLGGITAPSPAGLFSGVEGAIAQAGMVVGAIALAGLGLLLLAISSGSFKPSISVGGASK